jgi:hypothetical protein
VELKRIVLTAIFSDPDVATLRVEQTWLNPKGSPNVRKIELAMDGEFFSNLTVHDSQNRSLEITPSDMASSPGLIEIKAIDPIKEGALFTVFLEYTISRGRPASPLIREGGVLFRNPVYAFDAPLGTFTRWVYIQPPPKLLIELDDVASFLPGRGAITRVLEEPPETNSILVKFERVEKDDLTVYAHFVQEFLRKIGFVTSVRYEDGKIRVDFRSPVSKFSRLLPSRFRSVARRVLYRRYTERRFEDRAIAKVTAEVRKMEIKTAVVAVSLHLPRPLRAWFWAVIALSVYVGLFSPGAIISGSVITLLAVTRSWLFYEEKMMRRAGYVFAGLLVLNILNMALVLLTSKPIAGFEEPGLSSIVGHLWKLVSSLIARFQHN